MSAAGTMPGALKLLWQPAAGGYHMEYGFSCMGYEVAGALALALALPDREIICFVGDGSYMMANSGWHRVMSLKSTLAYSRHF